MSVLSPEIDDLHKAAMAGNAEAQFNLGVAYANGRGVSQDDVEAVNWFRRAADGGRAGAQFNLGVMYANGRGVPQDDLEAAGWYRKAAEQGNPAAQLSLAIMYTNGRGVPQDDLEAVGWYRKAAEQGNPYAQHSLGVMYANGRGVSQDDGAAFRWFCKAAEQGYARAQYHLGDMYEHGRSVPRDDDEAVNCYRKAAEQGYARAQNNLGVMYSNGRGVPQDDLEAARWYRKAAEQGNPAAQLSLAIMYTNGRGVPQDDLEAVGWYRKSAEQGNPAAQNNLGVMYAKGRGVSQDDATAFSWFCKAAEQGYARAQYQLGDMYEHGRSVPADIDEAVNWYRKAAEQGYAGAQNNLGAMYEYGYGVPENDVEAARWYRKAAEQGHAYAQCNLGLMYDEGRGVQQDDVEAVSWYLKASEQGDADAQCSLALMYDEGRGVQQNDVEAASWYRKAAEQGHAEAQYNLGRMCDEGRGVPEDEESEQWFRRAAEQGHAEAQYELGLWYEGGDPQEDIESAGWYRKAADQGHAEAQYSLGYNLFHGRGAPQNDSEAVQWWKKAAEQGHAKAQYTLGLIYENGRGVPQDDVEAVMWYRKAAERGNGDALNALAQLEEKARATNAGQNPIRVAKNDVPAPATSKQAAATKAKRSDAPARSLRPEDECKVLFEACVPTLYRNNAFRVLGLSVCASVREIKRRVDELRAAEDMGEVEEEHTQAFALEPLPALDAVKSAAKRMEDPEHRLIDEFFWFWPLAWAEAQSTIPASEDPALSAITRGDTETALAHWETALQYRDTESLIARHNLAVYHHMLALDRELQVLAPCRSGKPAPDFEDVHWDVCLEHWEVLTDDEQFWRVVTERIRFLDDARLSTGFARRLRLTFPEALDHINAALALRYAESEQFHRVGVHMEYMERTHSDLDDIAKTLRQITLPLRKRIEDAVERAKSAPPTEAMVAAAGLKEAAKRPLEALSALLPETHKVRIDTCDLVASASLDCVMQGLGENRDWKSALPLLIWALSLAHDKALQDAIRENRDLVTGVSLLDPIIKRCAEAVARAEERPSQAAEEANRLQSSTEPLLQNLNRSSAPPELKERGNNEMAAALTQCAIEYANKTSDWPPCVRLLEVALKLASDAALRARIEENLRIVRQNTNVAKSMSAYSHSAQPPKPDHVSTSSYITPLIWMGAFLGVVFLVGWVMHQADKSSNSSPASKPSYTTSPSQQTSPATSSSLSTLRQRIDSGKNRADVLERQLTSLDGEIETLSRQMDSYRSLGDTSNYNQLVPRFNRLVSERESVYAEYSATVNRVNSDVNRYNSGAR